LIFLRKYGHIKEMLLLFHSAKRNCNPGSDGLCKYSNICQYESQVPNIAFYGYFLFHFQTGAITAIIFLAFALIFVDDIAGYVIAFMKKVIDFPRATGTAHLPVEEQEKKEQELHQFLRDGINM